MQVELGRCITTAQQILADLGPFVPAQLLPQHNASAILSNIVSSGIPKIEDSRIPAALGVKLHEVTVSFFQKACMGLLETHGHTDTGALRSLALQLQRAYTNVYERKVLQAACTLPRPRLQEKQPYATDILVYAFEHSQTPSRRERERLATLTGMTVEQVRVWFQNRRSRNKKKPTELQSRPSIPLHDLLERVAMSRKAAEVSKDGAQNDFDDSNDSGYGSGADRPASRLSYCSRKLAALPTPAPTTRSYPAVYVPEPMSCHTTFAPPRWARTPATSSTTGHATVTIDELTRSMARLTLRHRRPSPRPSTDGVPANIPARGDPILAPDSAGKRARKDARAVRRVAGAQRAASNLAASAASLQPIVVPAPTAQSLSDASPPSCNSRKKAGPPRRKPAGRTLCRQVSAASSASTSSSASCRSTSMSSDVSIGSAESDFSMTSIDSHGAFQSSLDGAASLVSFQQAHEALVPVYDLSSMTFSAPDASAPISQLSTLLGDPEMLQLLQATQLQQQQNAMVKDPSTVELPFVADSQVFDVGLASMDVYLDFSTTAFPTLDALLSGNDAHYSTRPAQPRPQDINWHCFGLPVPAGA